MKENITKDTGSRVVLLFNLTLIKIFYMVSVDLMLPQEWLMWSFNKDINWIYLPLELLVFFVVAAIYLRTQKTNTIYSFLATAIFLVFFIPNNSVLVLSGYDFYYYTLINLFSAVLFIAIGILSSKEQKRIDKKPIEISDDGLEAIWQNKKLITVIRLLTLLFCGIALFQVYQYNGLDFNILFSDMYDTRAEYADFAEGLEGSLLSYVLMIVTRTYGWFLLVCLYVSIMAKKYFDVLLCLFTYLAIFTMEMQKSTLAFLAVVFFVAILEKTKKLKKISYLSVAVILVFFVVVMIEYFVAKESQLFTLVVRREFYMPSYLSKIYFDFFNNNPKIWFTQDVFLIKNILKPLFGSPYTNGAVHIIARNCFSDLIESPNNGLFSEAFSQMGVLSIVVFPIIYAIYSKVMGDAASRFGTGVALVIMAKLTLSFLNAPVLQSGRVIGVIMFALISYFVIKPFSDKKVIQNTEN